MRNVRTAKGKKLDMAGLAAKHEEVRAISNVSMNARGDRLDKNGNVAKTVRVIAQKQHDMEEPAQMAPISNPTKVEALKQLVIFQMKGFQRYQNVPDEEQQNHLGSEDRKREPVGEVEVFLKQDPSFYHS